MTQSDERTQFKGSADASNLKELLNSMTLTEKIGQMCVPILQSGFLTDDVINQITQYKVGMIRYCPNAEFDNASAVVGEPNKYFTASQMAEFTNSLQKLAMQTDKKIPLIIAVDQEGGTRNDINRGGALVYGSHMSFGAVDDAQVTYKIAKATAKEFAAMGINMVQAPIVDVYRPAGRNTMKAATFGEDIKKVCKHAMAMKKGFEDGGIIAMIKHFPGYGSLSVDAHKGTARITKSIDVLEKEDIAPFIELFKDGVSGIMAGHVITECIDNDLPATLSYKMINGYLRDKLGFDGIIETDAMRMRAIQDRFGTGAASVMAIKAGCDLVLLRGNMTHFTEGYNAILHAAENGEITMNEIDTAVVRILRQKEIAGLFKKCLASPEAAEKLVGCDEHKQLIANFSKKSISLIKEKLIPLSKGGKDKISVICVEPQKIAAACDSMQSVDMLIRAVKDMAGERVTGFLTALQPTEEQIAKAVEMAQNSDIIILGCCNAILYDQQAVLADLLQKANENLIVVALESPMDIDVLPVVNDYICTFGVANDSVIAAAKVIFGDEKAAAKPPVTIKAL